MRREDNDASTSYVRRVARKRQLPVRFNDFFFVNYDLNITGECNGESKCCALYACEHGPLCVCARQRARHCDASMIVKK